MSERERKREREKERERKRKREREREREQRRAPCQVFSWFDSLWAYSAKQREARSWKLGRVCGKQLNVL